MYPFGSGMPQPTPPQPQHNQNVPFGAACWVNPHQGPYSQQPPPPSSYPPQSQYPSSQPPYPATSQPPYSAPSQSPYPPQSSPYPPQTTSYPSPAGNYPHNSPYPSNQMPYPGSQQQQPSYAPPNANPAYPGAGVGSSYPPSSATSSYPPPSQYPSGNNSSPYPTQSFHQSSYPTTSVPYGSATSNMAQCFSEMRSHNQNMNKGTPTVLPASNFDPVKDAHDLRKAMKGFGTDEDALINIICKRTNAQRQEIQRQFKTHFGKDLIEDIKSETSGNFQKLLVGLLHPIEEFYCMEICDAMAGLGTDEDVLIETFCTLSNSEIHTIKKTYLRMYGAHLESELKSETSGHFKRLLVSLCAGARDESGRVDQAQAVNDARELLNAGELRVGTDESMFNMVLCQRNYEQLKLVFKEYENLTGHSLEKAIKREFSGDIMDGLLAIYKCVTNKAEFFASRLHKSMAGIGTNDKQLIRIVVTRCEIDMQDIKVAFERMYGKSLRSWIKGDTSGDYKHALYALIGENRSSS